MAPIDHLESVAPNLSQITILNLKGQHSIQGIIHA